MSWMNAEIHVYLDRDRRWRARARVTLEGRPVELNVGPTSDYAHGLLPLFLALSDALSETRKRKVVSDGDG